MGRGLTEQRCEWEGGVGGGVGDGGGRGRGVEGSVQVTKSQMVMTRTDHVISICRSSNCLKAALWCAVLPLHPKRRGAVELVREDLARAELGVAPCVLDEACRFTVLLIALVLTRWSWSLACGSAILRMRLDSSRLASAFSHQIGRPMPNNLSHLPPRYPKPRCERWEMRRWATRRYLRRVWENHHILPLPSQARTMAGL